MTQANLETVGIWLVQTEIVILLAKSDGVDRLVVNKLQISRVIVPQQVSQYRKYGPDSKIN